MAAELLRFIGLSALTASAAVLAVLLARLPLRRVFGARAGYLAWALVPAAALVPLLPPPLLPAAMPLALTVPQLATMPSAAVAQPAFDAMPFLLALWCVGFAVASTLLVLQQRRFERALGRLSTIDPDTARAQTSAGGPALLGLLRPRIVLPADFEQRYDATERELILAHERLHRARGDVHANALAALLRCVYWFNPLFHYAASRLRFDQELACDAAVLSRFPEARRRYADAMLKTQLADLGLPAGCHWQSSHPLKERIAMLKQPLPGRLRRVLGAAAAVFLVGTGSYAAWAGQPPAPAARNAPPPVAAKPASDSRERHVAYRTLQPIDYPAAALAAKVEGVVYVSTHIDAQGRVAQARVDHIDPPAATVLADAALDGVRGWTFDPARHDGIDIASDVLVPVVFALDPGDHSPRTERAALGGIQVSPRHSAAADSPPTEDVSYRMMFPPQYPAQAIQAKQSARLTFDVGVDAGGVPQNVRVASSDPPDAEQLFAAQSIEAIRKWRFNPAIKDGKPQAGHLQVPIEFRITDDDG